MRKTYVTGMMAAGSLLAAPGAQAEGWFDDVGFNIGGFIRPEYAYSLSSDDNPANQLGNFYNEQSVARQAYSPPSLVPVLLGNLGLPPLLPGQVGTWTTLPLPAIPGLAADASSPGLRGVNNATGEGTPMRKVDNDTNYAVIRSEVELGVRFTPNLNLTARLRGIYDPVMYDEFDARRYANIQGGISGGDPALYAGKPNYFEYRVEGDNSPNPLEWAGDDYLLYFPSLVLEYNNGPLTVRAGNQQIAWGQALFFRVFDVVDGLDLRRHSVLDYAQEEYSDKRVPSLGLRLGYQFNEEVLVDSYVQKFQPTIYGNPNTQYNVIPAQFTVHDRYAEGGWDSKLSYGMRVKGNYGQWGFQAMAVQRYNPDGVFRWTQSGVNKDLPSTPGSTGQLVNMSLGLSGSPSSGTLLAGSAFEASPGGVYSAQEWFTYAGFARLNAISGLNASITEFPTAGGLFATPVDTVPQAYNELNTFFIAAGGSLRGHIAREYAQEEVFGLGASYVTEGEPGGLLDQLIINFEVSYTPDRTFTNTSLSRNYIKEDSVTTALVLEKYHRFTQAFPATYIVFQHMYRSVDDLFGRHLSGYGGTVDKAAPGVDGAHYFAFAFQQPFPQDIYRIGFATLYDPRGSILVQPGIKWKPSGDFTVEAFYSYIDGAMGSANPNDTLLSTVDYADEVTVRLTYQF
ncbi:hypothetical protein D0B54_03960 [Solimonas sp. K1W22B-7]|uniref:DUF1302 family protein n=1 Tax=Solimonas sp. K1W22B-7 TaxID=2303331 RepID=UPI000E32FF66|nr:DUF1302 family protein [Solimonas sp. K1W22B-7]AXQ27881.1 hypothetical protein D0B54_03960 [Solimonas sp. K1W22B-7]